MGLQRLDAERAHVAGAVSRDVVITARIGSPPCLSRSGNPVGVPSRRYRVGAGIQVTHLAECAYVRAYKAGLAKSCSTRYNKSLMVHASRWAGPGTADEEGEIVTPSDSERGVFVYRGS